jgi:hypothetical protein
MLKLQAAKIKISKKGQINKQWVRLIIRMKGKVYLLVRRIKNKSKEMSK